MSDDSEWIDAGDTTGVGTNIYGCLPFILLIVLAVVGLRHLCEFVPETVEFLREKAPWFVMLFGSFLGIGIE